MEAAKLPAQTFKTPMQALHEMCREGKKAAKDHAEVRI